MQIYTVIHQPTGYLIVHIISQRSQLCQIQDIDYSSAWNGTPLCLYTTQLHPLYRFSCPWHVTDYS